MTIIRTSVPKKIKAQNIIIAILASVLFAAIPVFAAKPSAGGGGSLPSYVYAYVSVDADADRKPSVGDTIRWFVSNSSDSTITMTCWTDNTKSTQTQTYTSPTLRGPLTGYGTVVDAIGIDASTILTSAGYCESTGKVVGGNSFGFHWFMVAP